jgi:hypothetical protein
VFSWLGWCSERGYDGPAVPAWERLAPPDSETGQARMLLDEHTALGGKPGPGGDLHEWRVSCPELGTSGTAAGFGSITSLDYRSTVILAL